MRNDNEGDKKANDEINKKSVDGKGKESETNEENNENTESGKIFSNWMIRQRNNANRLKNGIVQIEVPGAINLNDLSSGPSSISRKSGNVNSMSGGTSETELMTQQISELNKKHAELYLTLNEVREWVSESRKQSDILQKQMDDISDKSARVTGELENVKLVAKVTKTEFDTQVDKFNEDIVASRNSVLGMIALFASFFSFISVSISIFSKSMPLSLSISIVLILWICLVSFLYIFMVSLNSGVEFFTKKSFFEHFVAVAVSLVFAMVTPYIIIDKVFKVEPIHYNIDKGGSEKELRKN
ncbi:hypothetical protein [Serratia proteamaculans]|uniref:hypothetical protein n=1 Tax=Serratia proteamaculans TaxID=28151 RepID=UPI002179070E|nr:hypothetical protein [Serratia proteamaculans]CAI1137763.1 Uncharacterised protein [Serratia proteamaculans]CAI1173667.1 Uncharacterised protein [Serratia proteamaculans]